MPDHVICFAPASLSTIERPSFPIPPEAESFTTFCSAPSTRMGSQRWVRRRTSSSPCPLGLKTPHSALVLRPEREAPRLTSVGNVPFCSHGTVGCRFPPSNPTNDPSHLIPLSPQAAAHIPGRLKTGLRGLEWISHEYFIPVDHSDALRYPITQTGFATMLENLSQIPPAVPTFALYFWGQNNPTEVSR